jgi:hypothetical protein
VYVGELPDDIREREIEDLFWDVRASRLLGLAELFLVGGEPAASGAGPLDGISPTEYHKASPTRIYI